MKQTYTAKIPLLYTDILYLFKVQPFFNNVTLIKFNLNYNSYKI